MEKRKLPRCLAVPQTQPVLHGHRSNATRTAGGEPRVVAAVAVAVISTTNTSLSHAPPLSKLPQPIPICAFREKMYSSNVVEHHFLCTQLWLCVSFTSSCDNMQHTQAPTHHASNGQQDLFTSSYHILVYDTCSGYEFVYWHLFGPVRCTSRTHTHTRAPRIFFGRF